GGLGDVLRGLAGGVGVVAGQPEDDRGQHDADDHGDEGDGRRVAGDLRATEVGEGGRQVDEGGDRAQHRRDRGGDVEGAVDRGQAALVAAGLGDVDADDGG